MRASIACCSALLVVAVVNCMPQDPHEATLESTRTEDMPGLAMKRQAVGIGSPAFNPYYNDYMAYMGNMGYGGYIPGNYGPLLRKRRAVRKQETTVKSSKAKRQIMDPFFYNYNYNYYDPYMRMRVMPFY